MADPQMLVFSFSKDFISFFKDQPYFSPLEDFSKSE